MNNEDSFSARTEGTSCTVRKGKICSRSCEIVIFGLGDACGVRNSGELFHSRMMLAHPHAIFWEKLSLGALWNEWIRVSSSQLPGTDGNMFVLPIADLIDAKY